MYLCDLMKMGCTNCPFQNYNDCEMDSKEEIITELEDARELITQVLNEIN